MMAGDKTLWIKILLLSLATALTILAEDNDVLMYEPSSSSGGSSVWSANWYYTNMWNSGSGSGSIVKAYGYCHSQSVDNPVSWLRTNFIDVKDSSVVHFQVNFTMRDCTKYSSLTNCRQTFDLHHYQRDSPVSGRGQSNQNIVLPDKYPGNFPFLQTLTGTKFGSSQNIISDPVPMTKKGVYFALKSDGGCYSVKAVKVTFQTCPEKIMNLAKFNATKNKQNSGNLARGECVPNASKLNGRSMFLECQSDGIWSSNGDQGLQCQCIPGFQNNQAMTACEECPIGFYKNSASNSPCLSCPRHSNSTITGQAKCDCYANYNRANWESAHDSCTALPSEPRYLKQSFDGKNSVHFQWTPPLSTGNRSDVYYLVSCSKCSRNDVSFPCEPCESTVQFFPSKNLTRTSVKVSGLTSYSSYSFTVTSLNGVSNKNNRQHWKNVSIFIITKKDVPGAPKILKILATDTEIYISWQMDRTEKINCELTDYEICRSSEETICEYYEKKPVPLEASYFPLKGLKPATEYKLKVRTKCFGVGYGEWSDEVTKTTLAQDQSSAIVCLSVLFSLSFIINMVLIGAFYYHFYLKKRSPKALSSSPVSNIPIMTTRTPSEVAVQVSESPSSYEEIEAQEGKYQDLIKPSTLYEKIEGRNNRGVVNDGQSNEAVNQNRNYQELIR